MKDGKTLKTIGFPRHLECYRNVRLKRTRTEVCSSSWPPTRPPEGMPQLCFVCLVPRARSEENRHHHIARAQLNSHKAPGLPPSVPGTVPSQPLTMGSMFLADKSFSPWYKNS